MRAGGGVSGMVGRLAWAAVDFVLPPRCLACGALIGGPRGLCATCWAGLNFIEGAFCARCGFPFSFGMTAGALCGACAAAPPAYRRARAALVYDDGSRGLILAFKHGDKLHGAGLFAAWMARAGAELLEGADLVVPVPLHWSRLFRRRYTPAALLATGVGRQGGLPVAPDLLTRRRRTPSQGGLNHNARHANVRGAFQVRPRDRATLRGARVLLVDDVMTTGATVEACARTLSRAGAAAVDVLCLARVAREAHIV
jgi:ComF family protein